VGARFTSALEWGSAAAFIGEKQAITFGRIGPQGFTGGTIQREGAELPEGAQSWAYPIQDVVAVAM
jgi:hypothetical protein